MQATLLHANPQYAHVQLPSGVETTVNIPEISPVELSVENPVNETEVSEPNIDNGNLVEAVNVQTHNPSDITNTGQDSNNTIIIKDVVPQPRRSTRQSKTPKMYGDCVTK